MSVSSYLIHRTISGKTTLVQIGPRSDRNERVLTTPPKFRHHSSFSVRLLDTICRTFAGWGFLPNCRDAVMVFCCILTFDPARHAIPKWCTGRKWHILMAVMGRKSRRRAWLTIWDKVKFHGTFIGLMHRKRVTWELHDSYFCLMAIKHAIPEILSGRLNYYITRWTQEVSEFGALWGQGAVEEDCTQQSGAPGLRLSSIRRTGKKHWWP